jgi:lipopolysaccharide transport system ATP-binding protein
MSRACITVAGLSKRYRIHRREEAIREGRFRFGHLAGQTFRHLRTALTPPTEDEIVWALKDVNFSIQPGEVVGIIGKNGAGKSTLLKILSRITEPTSGRAVIRGRLSSLLEVGTGFHPDLTGRENVFLSGAILGMTHREIAENLDQIVEFSEIGEYFDTPVKYYSSGMRVRLGFAVSVHLRPEILLVDEVLSVGDAAFRARCNNKIDRIASEGRTILMVSHNLNAIQSLCPRVLWIDHGTVAADGPPQDVVPSYLESTPADKPEAGFVDYGVRITDLAVRDATGTACRTVQSMTPCRFEVSYDIDTPLEDPEFVIAILGPAGTVLAANMVLDGRCPRPISAPGKIACSFHALPLLPGEYRVRVTVRRVGYETPITGPLIAGNFHVVGALGSLGLRGKLAQRLAANSFPTMVPYTWIHPDGSEHTVDFAPTSAP